MWKVFKFCLPAVQVKRDYTKGIQLLFATNGAWHEFLSKGVYNI